MEYFLAKDGQKFGPMSREDVQAKLAHRSFQGSDLIWNAGLPDWIPIDQHAEFSAAALMPSPGATASGNGLRVEPSLGPFTARSTAATSQAASLESHYEAFIGPEKASYYLPIFQRFDAGGSAAAWNWPAGLITQLWMLYRGMFLWGLLLYPILSFVASFAIGVLAILAFGQRAAALTYVLSLPASIAVMGLYGNKLFHDRVRKLIDKSATLGLSEQQRREWLIRKGAGNYIWAVIVPFFGIGLIGILAAIAIPAYQDYVYRVKVAQALTAVEPLKQDYADYLRQNRSLPTSIEQLNPESLRARYGTAVSSITIGDNNSLRITFKGPLIEGKTLALIPRESNGSLIWTCHAETLPKKLAPPDCRN